MALNVNDNTSAQSQAKPDIGFGSKAAETVAQPFGFGIGLKSNFSASEETESYNKIYQKLNEIVTSVNKEKEKAKLKYSLVKLYKNEDGLNYSCIALVQTNDTKAVFAHVLIIEKTGMYPNPVYENINGTRYEILRVPGDALDNRLVQVTKAKVASFCGVTSDTVIVIDGTLVPNEFNADSEDAIKQLAGVAYAAVDATYYSHIGAEGVNIAAVVQKNRNSRFTVTMSFNNDMVVYDQTGMPVREDICLSLFYTNSNNNNTKSINDSNMSVPILRVFGYIDFRMTMDQPTAYAPAMTKFIPNFVITHVETLTAMPTPDMMLLAIATCNVVNEDSNWVQVFKSTASRKGEIDYNDIGVLNVEGNIENSPTGYGAKIDTKSKSFTSNEFNNLINRLVRRGFMVSIDIPQAGPDTWHTSIFRAAASTSTDNTAYNALIKAADQLTNGIFTSVTGNRFIPIFVGTQAMIHGGYYKNRDGSIRDIREMSSYLSVANHVVATNQNLNKIAMFTNTMYNSAIPNEILASERKKLVDEMTKDSTVYKQYHNRYTFNAEFLQALISSLVSSGFTPTINGANMSNDMFQRRIVGTIDGAVLGGDLRLSAQNNYTNMAMYHGQNYSRW